MGRDSDTQSSEIAFGGQTSLQEGLFSDGSRGTCCEVPALPPHQAMFTLTQNVLGSGLLAVPFAVKSAGYVGGCGLLALMVTLTALSMSTLVQLGHSIGEFSYKDQASRLLGRRLSTVFEVWVLLYTLGICIGYPILLGDFLFSVLRDCGVTGAWCTQRTCMVLGVACVCWPLSCLPTLGALGRLSGLGVLFTVATVVIAVVRFADGSYAGEREGVLAPFNTKDFGSCFPVLVLAFGAHFNVPVLHKEVVPEAGALNWGTTPEGCRAFRRMFGVIFSSLLTSVTIYLATGIVIYATFGTSTADDFTKNYREDDPLITLVRCAMAFAVCVSFPLVMMSARMSIYNLFFRPRGWALSCRLRVAVTTLATACCLGVAAAAGGNLGIVLTYNGSIFGTPVCFVAPGVLYLCLPRASQKGFWRCSSVVVAVLGALFGIYTVVTVTLSLLDASKPAITTSFHFVDPS